MKYYIEFTSIYDRNVAFATGPIDEEDLVKFNRMCTIGNTRWMFMPLASSENSKVTITKEMIPNFVIVTTPIEEEEHE